LTGGMPHADGEGRSIRVGGGTRDRAEPPRVRTEV